MCYRLGLQLVVLLGGCTNFKRSSSHWGRALEWRNGTPPTPPSFVVVFLYPNHKVSGFVPQAHKQCAQPTMDWTLHNCESKEILFFISWLSQAFVTLMEICLTQRSKTQPGNPYGFKIRSFLYLPKIQRRRSDITYFILPAFVLSAPGYVVMVDTNQADMFKRISILDTWSVNIKTLSILTLPSLWEISEWHLFFLLFI